MCFYDSFGFFTLHFSLSQRIVPVYQLTAEKAAYGDVIYLVERRVKAAYVVAHLEQIIDVDDVFLAYLYEVVIYLQQSVWS